MSKDSKTDSCAQNAESSSRKKEDRRFQVRRTLLGSIDVEMFTDDIEGAFDLFMTFKGALDAHVIDHPASAFMDDVQHFCVWDTRTNNVAFHNGMFLTTYLLGEIEDE